MPSTDIDGWFDGFRGFRPSSELSIVAGAGGGWSSLVSSSTSDGKSISQPFNFAKADWTVELAFNYSEKLMEDLEEVAVSVGEEEWRRFHWRSCVG